MEKLEGEKDNISTENEQLRERLLTVQDEKTKLWMEVQKLRSLLGLPIEEAPIPAPIDLSKITIKQECDDLFPLTPQSTVIDPRASLSNTESLQSMSRSPSLALLDFQDKATSSDLTQHPAEMLCGLPCQSKEMW